jgi:glyoxylase-like metal-dependent hydrolase (beta-lactamase superfamily II)
MPTTRISRFAFVNCYLVSEDDGLTLIDTTLKGNGANILAAAERLRAPIARIALTHGHGDHVGALDELAHQLPQAEVAISARDARPLAGDMSTDPGEPSGKLKGSWPKVATTPTRLLQPGDTVGSLVVHAAPGHTPGHVAFLDPRDGTLYCGDAYSTLGGMATTARANPLFPFPVIATWDKPTALESAKALRALDPRALAPGHGKVVENPGSRMDAAIAKAGG